MASTSAGKHHDELAFGSPLGGSVDDSAVHDLDGDGSSTEDDDNGFRSPLTDLLDVGDDGLLSESRAHECTIPVSVATKDLPAPQDFVVVDPVPAWVTTLASRGMEESGGPVEEAVPDSELLQRVQQLFLADGSSRLDVSIVDVRLSEAARGAAPFALYLIEVTSGLRTWQVQRRYREFAALHRCLESALGSRVRLPALPGRLSGLLGLHLFQSPESVRSRMHGLQAYLRTVVHFPDAWTCDALAGFLDDSQRTLALQAIAAAAFAADSHALSLTADLASTRDELARLKSRMASLASKLESQTSLESISHLAAAEHSEVGGTMQPVFNAPSRVGQSPPQATFAATAAKFALSRVTSDEGRKLHSHSSAGSGFMTRENENAAASAAELALVAMLSSADPARDSSSRGVKQLVAGLPERFSSSSSDDSEPRLEAPSLLPMPQEASLVGGIAIGRGSLHGKSLLRISEIRSREYGVSARQPAAASSSLRTEAAGSLRNSSDVSAVSSRIRNVYAPVLGAEPEVPAVEAGDALQSSNDSRGRVINDGVLRTTHPAAAARLGRPRSRSCEESLGGALRVSEASASSEFDWNVDEGGTSLRVAFAPPLGLSKSVSLPGFWRSLTGGSAAHARSEPRGAVAPDLATEPPTNSSPSSSARGGGRAHSVLSAMFGGLRLSRPSPLRSFSRAEHAGEAAWETGPDLVQRVPASASGEVTLSGRDPDAKATPGDALSVASSAVLPRRRSASFPDKFTPRLPRLPAEGLLVVAASDSPDACTRPEPRNDAASQVGALLYGPNSVWRDAQRANAAAALSAMSPCSESNARRSDLIAFFSGLLKLSCGLQCVVVGSSATRTYLPDSTIDMVLLLPARQASPGGAQTDAGALTSTLSTEGSDHGLSATALGARPWFIAVNDALCNAAAACHSATRAARSNASTHSGGAESVSSKSRAPESAQRESLGSPLSDAAVEARDAATARLVSLFHGLSVAAGCFSATSKSASTNRQKSDPPEQVTLSGTPMSLSAAVDAAAFGFLAKAVDDSALLLAYVNALSVANERILETLQQLSGELPLTDAAMKQLPVDIDLLREACTAAAVVRALYEASTDRSEAPLAAANDLIDSEYGALLLSLAEGASADVKQRPRSGSDSKASSSGGSFSVAATPSVSQSRDASARAPTPATAQQIAAAVRAILSRGQPKWATAADGKAISLRNVTFHLGSQWPDFRRHNTARGVTRPFVTCVLDNVRVCVMGSEQHTLPRLPLSVNRLKDMFALHSAPGSTTEAAAQRRVLYPLPLQVGAMSPCHEIVRCAAFEDWAAALDSATSAASLVSGALPFIRAPDSPCDVDVALFTRRPVGDPLYLQADFVDDADEIPEASQQSEPLPYRGVMRLPSLGADHDRAVRVMLPHVRQTLVRVAASPPSDDYSYIYATAPPSRLAKQAIVLVTAFIRRSAIEGGMDNGASAPALVITDSMALSTASITTASVKDGVLEGHAPALSLRCVEILVLALFVEAAKCAAAAGTPGATVPLYAQYLPPSGYFSHAFDVLASFLAVYASLDFAATVVSPLLGIVPLADYVAALTDPTLPPDAELPRCSPGSLIALFETSFAAECKGARAQAIASALIAVMQGGSAQSGHRASRTRLDSCTSVDSAESEKQQMAALHNQKNQDHGVSGSVHGPQSVAQSDASSFSSYSGTVFSSPAGGRLRRALDADTVARISALTAMPTAPPPQPMATLLRAASSVLQVASPTAPFVSPPPFSVHRAPRGAAFDAPMPADVIGGALRISGAVPNGDIPAVAVAHLLEGNLQEVFAAHIPHALRASGAAFSHVDALACAKFPMLSSQEVVPSFFHAALPGARTKISGVASLAQESDAVQMHISDLLSPWVNQGSAFGGAVPGALRAVCKAGCESLIRQSIDPAAVNSNAFANLTAPGLQGPTSAAALASRHDMLHHPMQSRVLQSSQIAYTQEALRIEALSLSAIGDSVGPWATAPVLVASALAASDCEARRVSCADAVNRLLRSRLPILPQRGSSVYAAATVTAGARAGAAARRGRSTTRAASAATCTSAEALLSDDGAAADLFPPGAASLVGAELAPRFKLTSSVAAELPRHPWLQPLGVTFAFSNQAALSEGAHADAIFGFPFSSVPAFSRVQRIIDSVKAVNASPDLAIPRFFTAPFSTSPLDGDTISMVVARELAAVISYGCFTRTHAVALCVSALGARGISLPSSLATCIKGEAGCAQAATWFRGPFGGLPHLLSQYPHLFSAPGLPEAGFAPDSLVSLASHSCLFPFTLVPSKLVAGAHQHLQLRSQLASVCAKTVLESFEALARRQITPSDYSLVAQVEEQAQRSLDSLTGSVAAVTPPLLGPDRGPAVAAFGAAVRNIFAGSLAEPALRLPAALPAHPGLRLLAALDAGMVRSIVESAGAMTALELGPAILHGRHSSAPLINLRKQLPPLALLLAAAEPLQPIKDQGGHVGAHAVHGGTASGPGLPVAPIAARSSNLKQEGFGIASSPRFSSRFGQDQRSPAAAGTGIHAPPQPTYGASFSSSIIAPGGERAEGRQYEQTSAVPADSAIAKSEWQSRSQYSMHVLPSASPLYAPAPSIAGAAVTMSAPPPPPPPSSDQVPQAATRSIASPPLSIPVGPLDTGVVSGGALLQLPLLGHVTFPDGRSIPVVMGPDGAPRYLLPPGS